MKNGLLRSILQRIAANVRRVRNRLGLTQEALAEAADVDLRTVQRVERVEMNMRIGILVKIANALNIAPSSLFRPAKLKPPKRGRPTKPKRKKR